MLRPSSLITDMWFGHVARMPSERLSDKVMQWKPAHGKRSLGISSKSRLDCVKENCYIAFGCKCNVKDMATAAEGIICCYRSVRELSYGYNDVIIYVSRIVRTSIMMLLYTASSTL